MPRYVAFLRGVSPLNAKMRDLKRCFEAAGFTGVKTLLSSGNVVFNARSKSQSALVTKIESIMAKKLDRTFAAIVRSTDDLNAIIASDPFAAFQLSAKAKRVVTFLREPHKAKLTLPIEVSGARILKMKGLKIFTAYLPNPRGPVFMALIERTFGTNITTRTWETVKKCAAA
jgi:uncharacterized protein (DUF1697 family)